MPQKTTFPKWLPLVVIVAILFIAGNPLVVVDAGYRGVVLTFGKVSDTVLNEGPHFRIPFVQKVIMMNVKIQKTESAADAATKDLQSTSSNIALNFHIDPERVNELYQKIGKNYEAIVILPAIQEITKAVAAKYTAIELITDREAVGNAIKSQLRTRLAKSYLIVDNFSIVDFAFSRQFNSAIEAKQTAEQQALKAKRDLERIQIEAEQKIASATAEAKSLELQKQIVTPELIELRKVEAQLMAIEKWNGVLPQVTGESVPMIQLK